MIIFKSWGLLSGGGFIFTVKETGHCGGYTQLRWLSCSSCWCASHHEKKDSQGYWKLVTLFWFNSSVWDKRISLCLPRCCCTAMQGHCLGLYEMWERSPRSHVSFPSPINFGRESVRHLLMSPVWWQAPARNIGLQAVTTQSWVAGNKKHKYLGYTEHARDPWFLTVCCLLVTYLGLSRWLSKLLGREGDKERC